MKERQGNGFWSSRHVCQNLWSYPWRVHLRTQLLLRATHTHQQTSPPSTAPMLQESRSCPIPKPIWPNSAPALRPRPCFPGDALGVLVLHLARTLTWEKRPSWRPTPGASQGTQSQFSETSMTTFPPVPVTRTRLTVLTREKLPCSPGTVPRAQLIKEKDDIDHYLEKNFKGLSKEEVAAHRNSYKKSICVEMLRDGYHKSFTELFTLMEQWDSLRNSAEVRSLFWLQRPLEEQPDKLDNFYHYLTRAEAAERQEYYEEVYNNLYALACYFDNSEDKWVRNHFYERCFNIAQLIKADGGKKEAEAQAHMGLLFEEEGDLLEAAQHYEAFHELTQGRIWKDETGQFLNQLACESLVRTYRLLSDRMLENKEYKQAIRILIKASEIAKEGSDRSMEGEAALYLGSAHLAAGEYGTALKVLRRYSEIATSMGDDLNLGRAYEAIAKVLQSQGQMTEAINYLEKVVKIARNNFQSLNVIRACTMLGDIYNEKGQYSQASEYFQQAFSTTVDLTKAALMDETKVHYGIARAHQMMFTMKNYIESADMDSLNCLLSWKESRTQIKYDPVLGETTKATEDDIYQYPDTQEETTRSPDNQ